MWVKAVLCVALAIALVQGYVKQSVKTEPTVSSTPTSSPSSLSPSPAPPSASPKEPINTSSSQSPAPPSADQPITRSPSGVFRGSWDTTRRGRRFQSYRGIKYAEAPVGELRFQPPKPILTYPDEVDATEDGPACPLIAPPTYPVSEDCLTINVYTPDNKSKKPLPVIFYIHAGGFYSMAGRSDLAGPHYLLDRDLVLVTINYRLGALGWLSTGDAVAPGNNGMKDQVAALQWVRRNIAAFGGDPGAVTVSGCSAGSISVMLHMISPMSEGLFHRAISMSASPVGKEPFPRHQRPLADRQARLLHCPHNNSTVILDCLRTKTWQELGDWRGLYEFGSDPVGLWSPVVEPAAGQARFLALDPLTAIRQRRMHAVPYIISQTQDEFFWFAYNVLNNSTLRTTMSRSWSRVSPVSFMLPRDHAEDATSRLRDKYLNNQPLRNDEASLRGLKELYGDSIIGFPTHRLANLMCRYSSHPVWYYQFSYVGQHSHYEDPITKKPVGAAHHDDLIYLFSLSYRFPRLPPDHTQDSTTVDQMTALWYNFARYGDPNPRSDTPELGDLSWPAMKPHARKYLRLGTNLTVLENLNEERYKLWEELYPIQY